MLSPATAVAYKRFDLLAARESGGPILGVAMMELPLRDNVRSAEVTVAVHPAHRRRGVGTALVDGMAGGDGPRAVRCSTPLWTCRSTVRTTTPRFRSRRRSASRRCCPATSVTSQFRWTPDVWRSLRAEVRRARRADDYRVLTFEAPWPAEYLEDQCALFQCMSTDEPHGDEGHEEEVWNADRVRENDALRAARGARFLIAVAEHRASGRLVACTELSLAADSPGQAWQMLTVVEPEHRGHRLGLAVKIANVDELARLAPEVRVIVTGNASVNAPMIAVNEMMGFEVASEGNFWQKRLVTA